MNSGLPSEKITELFIAAFDLTPDERSRFLAENCDEDDRREIESLFEARDQAGSFLEDVSAVSAVQKYYVDGEDLSGRTVGQFRLIREIGRGGMGVVFLAAREDFKQLAALKLIKRGMDSDAIVERFRREREILAALDHPYIARLLDGGTTDEGTPFFVMEFVDGLPLDEYCKAEELSVNGRLKLFRKICEAVAYAHQKLIIHRDLKPSNILVTKDGTPKLLDFGIAKLLIADGGDDTQTQQQALTPAYASPEQVRGEPADTTSDVYSLGKILANLLQTAAGGVRASDRRLKNEALDTDLRAILQTATGDDTARRYGSVEKFSEDIGRYLDGLPVTAHKDSFTYRAVKFIKRNRLAAAAVAAVAITLVGGIGATSWEAHTARLERARAERRFNDVRQITNSFMFELNDEIQKGPTQARAMLVSKALEYLDSLAAEANNDAGLQRELAVAYMKLGDIQSKAYSSNIGDTAGALESYKKATQVLESLNENGANTPEDLRLLSEAEEGLGSRQSLTNDHDNAVANLKRSLDTRLRLVALDDGNIEYKRLLASSYLRHGDALSAKYTTVPDDTLAVQIMEDYTTALGLFESLAAAGGNMADRYKLAILHQRLSTRYVLASERSGDPDLKRSVLAEREKALQVCHSMLQIEPNNRQYQRCYIAMTADVAASKFDLNEDTQETLETCVAAINDYKRLSAADPADMEIRRDLGHFHQSLADLYDKSGEIDAAIRAERESVKTFEELMKADSTRLNDTRPDLIHACTAMAKLLQKHGDRAEALEYTRRSESLDPKRTADN